MTTYTVIVTREDGAWLADVPEVSGAHTFARSLPSLMKSVREVIILMDDLDNDAEPELKLIYEVKDPLLVEATAAGQRRLELAAQEKYLQTQTAGLASQLTAAGYSVRDAAVLLDLTPGRISQLTK